MIIKIRKMIRTRTFDNDRAIQFNILKLKIILTQKHNNINTFNYIYISSAIDYEKR